MLSDAYIEVSCDEPGCDVVIRIGTYQPFWKLAKIGWRTVLADPHQTFCPKHKEPAECQPMTPPR